MNRILLITGCLCAAMLLVANAAVAQQRGPTTAQRGGSSQGEEVIVRSYDVSDLIRTNSDYAADGISNLVRVPTVPRAREFQPSQQPSQPAVSSVKPAPINAESLVQLLLSTVNPESWRDNGGAVGNVRPLGTILVVQQTRAAHDQILQLLGDLRQIVGPMQTITVHATWVSVSAGLLPRATTDATDEWMSKQKVFCESQISCFSGQTVHLIAEGARSYISDATPVVASNAVAFDPTISVISSGAVLQLTPLLVPGGSEAIVDVQSAVSQAGGPLESATAVAVSGESVKLQVNATIDRVADVSQRFHTTARVPLKKRTIIGGMTMNPAKPEDQGTQLYLVIEVTAGK